MATEGPIGSSVHQLGHEVAVQANLGVIALCACATIVHS